MKATIEYKNFNNPPVIELVVNVDSDGSVCLEDVMHKGEFINDLISAEEWDVLETWAVEQGDSLLEDAKTERAEKAYEARRDAEL